MKQIQTYEDVLSRKNIINKDRAWDIPGGVSIKPDNLIKGRFLPEGTPVAPPNASGYRRVCKQALVLEGSSAQLLIVDKKFNHFKEGDIVMKSKGTSNKAYKIASVLATAGDKEVLKVSTVIATVTKSTKPFLICEAATVRVGAATTEIKTKSTPDCITKFGMEVPNADLVMLPVGVYTRADVLENTIADPYLDQLKHINVIKY